jgi:hypothetical protein
VAIGLTLFGFLEQIAYYIRFVREREGPYPGGMSAGKRTNIMRLDSQSCLVVVAGFLQT